MVEQGRSALNKNQAKQKNKGRYMKSNTNVTASTTEKGPVGRPRKFFVKTVTYKKVDRDGTPLWVKAGRGRIGKDEVVEKKRVPFNAIPEIILAENY